MTYKVSLAGDQGSGKSSVSKILLADGNLKYFSTGGIIRDYANELGVSIVEMNKLMGEDPKYDTEVDNRLRALSDVDDDLLIDSRLAWHFVKDTFRIYMSCDLQVAAARIYYDDRREEAFGSVEETAEKILERKRSEQSRYLSLYGVDIKDLSNYDLILDTSYVNREQVADKLRECIEAYKKNRSFRGCFLNPERLCYRADGVDLTMAAGLARQLEMGGPVPTVTVMEHEGRFYVVGGAEAAFAYVLSFCDFIPCELVAGKPEDPTLYVPMSSSL